MTVSVVQGSGTHTYTVEEIPHSDYIRYAKITVTATPDQGYVLDKIVFKSRSIYENPNTGVYTETPFTTEFLSTPAEVFETETNLNVWGFCAAVIVDGVDIYFHGVSSAAISLQLSSVPQGVGVLSGGGLRSGYVGDPVTYDVTAQLPEAMKYKYQFLYWVDDQGVKHNERSFSKTFTFKTGYNLIRPEVITFTAHFAVRTTGLILRSASSGTILHGRLGRILRDE